MVQFPICKLNLGLYVTRRREDGMHDLSTVFLPIQFNDTLEIVPLDETYAEDIFHLTGTKLPGGEGADNLVIKTIQSLREDYQIPYMEVWLHKRIPTGAGLGGGSSDAAYTMRMINEMCELNLSDEDAIKRLSKLGADCAFFWKAKAAYAEGIGEKLENISLPELDDMYVGLVKPAYGVSTREAFQGIIPQEPKYNLRESLNSPIENWRECVGNDFEKTVFAIHPELAAIKQTLYDMGAVYAQMSGSGSTMFGLFKHRVDEELESLFPTHVTHCSKLRL